METKINSQKYLERSSIQTYFIDEGDEFNEAFYEAQERLKHELDKDEDRERPDVGGEQGPPKQISSP